MLLSMLRLDCHLVDIDLLSGDQTQERFLRINPLNKVPVLDDDGFVLRDSTAIMLYLAQKYGSANWAPNTPEDHGRYSSGCPFRSMRYSTVWQRPERLSCSSEMPI